MVFNCCVPFCKNKSSTPNINLHRFPKDIKLSKFWVENIRKNAVNCEGNFEPDKITKWTKICSAHFERRFIEIRSEKSVLKPDAVPTIFECVGDPKTMINSPLNFLQVMVKEEPNSDSDSGENFVHSKSHQDYSVDLFLKMLQIKNEHSYSYCLNLNSRPRIPENSRGEGNVQHPVSEIALDPKITPTTSIDYDYVHGMVRKEEFQLLSPKKEICNDEDMSIDVEEHRLLETDPLADTGGSIFENTEKLEENINKNVSNTALSSDSKVVANVSGDVLMGREQLELLSPKKEICKNALVEEKNVATLEENSVEFLTNGNKLTECIFNSESRKIDDNLIYKTKYEELLKEHENYIKTSRLQVLFLETLSNSKDVEISSLQKQIAELKKQNQIIKMLANTK